MSSWFSLLGRKEQVPQQFHVIVRDLEKVLFDGSAKAVSSFNTVGQFDVLPGHAHFISLVRNSVVLYVGKERKSFPVEQGILRVKDGRINIFLGLESLEAKQIAQQLSV